MTTFNNISVAVHPRKRGSQYIEDAINSISARIKALKESCAGVYTEEDIKKLDNLNASMRSYTGRNYNQVWRDQEREYTKKPRVYIHVADETIMDNLMNRRARPYQIWKQEVLPQVLAFAGLSDVKASWSAKAGCSMCPCSPGFILDHNGHFDIYVTVNGPRTTLENDVPEVRWLEMA